MPRRAKPTSRMVPLIVTPEMRLKARFQFWERIEYFALGMSAVLLIVILATGSWPRLGFLVFAVAMVVLAGNFKKHVFLSAEDGYRMQAEEEENCKIIHLEGRN